MKCATRKSNFYFHYSILIQLSRLTAGAKNSFCPYGRSLKPIYSIQLCNLSHPSDSSPVNFTVCKTSVIINNIEKLKTLSLFLAPLGDIKIKQCPLIHCYAACGVYRRLLPQAKSKIKFNVNL